MKFLANVGIFALAAYFSQTISAAPLASNQTSTATASTADSNPEGSGLGSPIVKYGCSCYWWRSQPQDDWGNKVIKVKCDKVGRGVKVVGLSGKLGYTPAIYEPGQTVETREFQEWVTDVTDFQLTYWPSGNADMGDCKAELKVEEHTIKNDYWVEMTCNDIAPGLRAKGDLMCTLGDEYTPQISQPGTVTSPTTECWLGSPDVRVMYDMVPE